MLQTMPGGQDGNIRRNTVGRRCGDAGGFEGSGLKQLPSGGKLFFLFTASGTGISVTILQLPAQLADTAHGFILAETLASNFSRLRYLFQRPWFAVSLQTTAQPSRQEPQAVHCPLLGAREPQPAGLSFPLAVTMPQCPGRISGKDRSRCWREWRLVPRTTGASKTLAGNSRKGLSP